MELTISAASSGAFRFWALSNGVLVSRHVPLAGSALSQVLGRKQVPLAIPLKYCFNDGVSPSVNKRTFDKKETVGGNVLRDKTPCAHPSVTHHRRYSKGFESGLAPSRSSLKCQPDALSRRTTPPVQLVRSSRGRLLHIGAQKAINQQVALNPNRSSGIDNSKEQHLPSLEKASSAYIHIPFCKRRCFYCDFPIQVVGSQPDSGAVIDGMESYVNTLCEEIDVAAAAAYSDSHEPLRTVFFGGGTPSLLPPKLLNRLLKKLDQRFGIGASAEIAMEMDPGTFDEAKLRAFMAAGVNRLSMGVQGFQDDLLKACGRSHGLADVYAAIDTVHKVGVSNWSLDLISSLPHQTPELWQHSLDQAVQASPSHVSVYDLQIEDGTSFGRWFKPGQSPLPGDDEAADMYRQAVTTLTAAGYRHYEVSNYAKPGYECRHNMVYWKGAPFFAFGLGAASYTNRQRFSRPKKMSEYLKWVEQYKASGGAIVWPQDGAEDQLLDWLMLRMRLAEGFEMDEARSLFGETVASLLEKALTPFIASGHVLVSPSRVGSLELGGPVEDEESRRQSLPNGISRPSRYRLSDPEGFLVSNEVLSTLFASLPSQS